MKSTISMLVVLVVLTAGVIACQTYWHANPVSPQNPVSLFPSDSVNIETCKAPLIVQNIVGTWKFEHRFNNDKRYGSVSFTTNQVVIDSDSLFDNHLGRIDVPIQNKLYSVQTDSTGVFIKSGGMLWVTQYGTDQAGVYRFVKGRYYKVIANECHRVAFQSIDNTIEQITLTR